MPRDPAYRASRPVRPPPNRPVTQVTVGMALDIMCYHT